MQADKRSFPAPISSASRHTMCLRKNQKVIGFQMNMTHYYTDAWLSYPKSKW